MLRAAGPYQRSRRKRAGDENRKLWRAYVEKGNMHRWVVLHFRGFKGLWGSGHRVNPLHKSVNTERLLEVSHEQTSSLFHFTGVQ